MLYKTTYFKLSINDSISLLKPSENPLIQEIEKLSEDFENGLSKIEHEALDKYRGKIFQGSSDLYLEFWKDLNQIWGELKTKYSIHFLMEEVKLSKEPLLSRKIHFEKLKERRFTENDNYHLEQHLNTIASEGWSLFSMTPISKGLCHSSAGKISVGGFPSEGGYGIGYGHDLMEGFVLVWQKLK